jgi:hypothetical protein
LCSNNPLANIKALNFQNYYIPDIYGLPDQTANTFWIRGVFPVKRWVFRASLPIKTVPAVALDAESGVGDFDIFAAYLISDPSSPNQYGVGPLLVVPTATDDALGTGKWQIGAAAVTFLMANPMIQGGGLLTWQASFAGDSDRASTSLIVAQPFGFWQLGGGAYLRSAPLWVFNLKTGDYVIPFGLGIGKVLKVNRTVFNLFIEPQVTILHDGIGQPAFQVFGGINMQFTQ